MALNLKCTPDHEQNYIHTMIGFYSASSRIYFICERSYIYNPLWSVRLCWSGGLSTLDNAAVTDWQTVCTTLSYYDKSLLLSLHVCKCNGIIKQKQEWKMARSDPLISGIPLKYQIVVCNICFRQQVWSNWYICSWCQFVLTNGWNFTLSDMLPVITHNWVSITSIIFPQTLLTSITLVSEVIKFIFGIKDLLINIRNSKLKILWRQWAI